MRDHRAPPSNISHDTIYHAPSQRCQIHRDCFDTVPVGIELVSVASSPLTLIRVLHQAHATANDAQVRLPKHGLHQSLDTVDRIPYRFVFQAMAETSM